MFARFFLRFTVVLCLLLMGFAVPNLAGDKPVYVDGIDAAFPPSLTSTRAETQLASMWK